jgi:hypothetical protein
LKKGEWTNGMLEMSSAPSSEPPTGEHVVHAGLGVDVVGPEAGAAADATEVAVQPALSV